MGAHCAVDHPSSYRGVSKNSFDIKNGSLNVSYCRSLIYSLIVCRHPGVLNDCARIVLLVVRSAREAGNEGPLPILGRKRRPAQAAQLRDRAGDGTRINAAA